MEFNMPASQKLAMLVSARDSVEAEIYTLLVKMGVDPETYDQETPLVTDTAFTGERQRVTDLITSLTKIKEKITELS